MRARAQHGRPALKASGDGRRDDDPGAAAKIAADDAASLCAEVLHRRRQPVGKRFNPVDRCFGGQGQAHDHRRRPATHRIDVAQVLRRGFPADVVAGGDESVRPCQPEVLVLDEGVDGDDGPAVGGSDDGGIVTGANEGASS